MGHLKQILKSSVRGVYDEQELRIQMGNRIVANFKSKLGIKPGTKEDESSVEAKKILRTLRLTHDRITDGVSLSRRRKFEYDGVISNYAELCLINQYIQMLEHEETSFRNLEAILDEMPIWTQYLKGVKGIGPAMGAVIVSEFDIHKAKYVSSLWKYAGLDVGDDGRGRSRRKEHLEESEYTDRNGEVKTKMGITFNPFLKTKLVGVLGSSFLKSKSPFSDVYYDYRRRLENMAAHATWVLNQDSLRDIAADTLPPFVNPNIDNPDKTEGAGMYNPEELHLSVDEGGKKMYTVVKKHSIEVEGKERQHLHVYLSQTAGKAPKDAKPIAIYRKNKSAAHRHNMANRYMVKIFLQDLYANWKEIEGLEAHPPYHEAKLGMVHAQ